MSGMEFGSLATGNTVRRRGDMGLALIGRTVKEPTEGTRKPPSRGAKKA